MTTLVPLGKTFNPDPIVRSLEEGPDYHTHWRFLICEQYLCEIARSPDKSVARRKILSAEKDDFVKQLLLFHAEDRSSKPGPIEYALRCYRSRNENLTATKISAMVIAGRSPRDIAQEVGSTRANVVAYEKIFFDVRRYLPQRFWIKELCHFPSRMTVLGEGASRCLITACERGWNGLAFMFSTSRSDSKAADKWKPESVGKSLSDMISLGLAARLVDFIATLEMNGVKPTAQEMELFLKLGLIGSELPSSFHQLGYPPAFSPKEEKKRREDAKLVDKMSFQSRRKLVTLLERILYRAEFGQEGQSKPSGSS